MAKKEADAFGIAPAVAKRLCEWADLEGQYSKEREEKFSFSGSQARRGREPKGRDQGIGEEEGREERG